MKKLNFDKVKEALRAQTRESNNFITLCRGARDARDSNSVKYYTKNIVTNNTQESFKTLKEVIKYFELEF